MPQLFRNFALLFGGFFLIGFLLWGLFSLVPPPSESEIVEQPKTAPPIAYVRTSFDQMEGWAHDNLLDAIPAFLRSCQVMSKAHNTRQGEDDQDLLTKAWADPCAAAHSLLPDNENSARAFFETWFTPLAIYGEGKETGLFSGYYEPEMKGSRIRSERYATPLHHLPADLVQVNLGQFRDTLKGLRVSGRVIDGRLQPYEGRAEIESGAIDTNLPVIAYIDNWVDAFFLHIQGSGRVLLDSGEVIRVGYAGQNGHPYTAIGGILIQRGEIDRAEMSMQAIRKWAEAHEAEARDLFKQNASYIFFRELNNIDPDLGPFGAQNVNLTPGRSLAVDATFHPLGLPIWVDTTIPFGESGVNKPRRRFYSALDIGGDSGGPVGGDVFWGSGKLAGEVAGPMKNDGTMVALFPHEVAEYLLATQGL